MVQVSALQNLGVDDVLEQVLLVAELEQRELKLEANLGQAPTSGDPRLAERLVANLIDNAIRHNHPTGSVQVATHAGGGRATITVANSGPIVPPSEIDRLFEPFQRLGGGLVVEASFPS